MKKTLLFLLASAGLTLQTFGQGQFVFANSATATTHIYTNATASTGQNTSGGVQIAGAGNYIFAVFYNSTTNSSTTAGVSPSSTPWLNGGWTFADYATNTASAGRLAGLAFTTLPTSANTAVSIYENLEIIGWNTQGGTVNTLAQFQTAYAASLAANTGVYSGLMYGYSSVASILLGNGVSPLNSNIFGAGTGQITGFTLGQVLGVTPAPEPGTMALAALGGASLLLFRRRK